MLDAQVIQKCRQGDIQPFRHLVHRYQSRALVHARILTGNDADAADAAQDAFLDAFQNLHRFDESREFYPWFYVLLRNRCFKLKARTKVRAGPREFVDIAAQSTSEELLDLKAALNQLSPEDREILVLKHQDGWTYDELAERLSIPRGTVMSRLFHARQRLLSLMSGSTAKETGGGSR
jgi:RNA polymerase sigma-70 factor, ECF subfamily